VNASAAWQTKEFCCLLVIFSVLLIATAGAIAHLVPILTDAGFSAFIATTAASTADLALILGRLVCGYLLDKIFAPYVVLASLLIDVGLLSISVSPHLTPLASISCGFGLGERSVS